MENIEQKIRERVTAEFASDRDMVGNEESLIYAEIIDSLGIFLLIGFLEEDFGVVVDPAEVTLDNFNSIDSIAGFVKGKLAAGAV